MNYSHLPPPHEAEASAFHEYLHANGPHGPESPNFTLPNAWSPSYEYPYQNYPPYHEMHLERIDEELYRMTLMAENAILHNLSTARVITGRERAQEHLLNLCYYVTRNKVFELDTVNWLMHYASWSIGATLDSLYHEDPLKMPIILLAYFIEQAALPPSRRRLRLPPRIAPKSYIPTVIDGLMGDYSEPLDFSLSGRYRDLYRTDIPWTFEETTIDPTAYYPTFNLPPFMSLLILTIANDLQRIMNPPFWQPHAHDTPLTVHEMWRRISEPHLYAGRETFVEKPDAGIPILKLFDVPTNKDWFYLRHWVSYYKESKMFTANEIAWLVTQTVKVQKMM